MSDTAPIIAWLRKDFRLADNPALSEASKSGRPIIPVFVLDEVVETYGAAPKWRLARAIEHFVHRLGAIGSQLTLRRGRAKDVLLGLARETGAQDIWWTRAYDPDSIGRDTEVMDAIKAAGLGAKSMQGHILFEPWTVSTKAGGHFKVYSPMWRAVKDFDVPSAVPAPDQLRAPAAWPKSDRLQDWNLDAAMNRGARVLAKNANVGEEAASRRLAEFLQSAMDDYNDRRDYPAEQSTSLLSEFLAWGEIGPCTVWHATMRAHQEGQKGAEHFLKELVWREFSYHLVYHTPRITHANWRPEWDTFPWSEEEDDAVLRWKQGRTGIPFVDAAMREMYVTGRMHNRSRMIAASYLTKHMMKHWRIGQKWFEECLIDWDPAANAMGWQWVSGSGPDAAPYFRIFNPVTQAQKFDPEERYIHRFVAELSPKPGPDALAFFDACPKSWGLSPDGEYADPIVGLAEGRQRALEAYQAHS